MRSVLPILLLLAGCAAHQAAPPARPRSGGPRADDPPVPAPVASPSDGRRGPAWSDLATAGPETELHWITGEGHAAPGEETADFLEVYPQADGTVITLDPVGTALERLVGHLARIELGDVGARLLPNAVRERWAQEGSPAARARAARARSGPCRCSEHGHLFVTTEVDAAPIRSALVALARRPDPAPLAVHLRAPPGLQALETLLHERLRARGWAVVTTPAEPGASAAAVARAAGVDHALLLTLSGRLSFDERSAELRLSVEAASPWPRVAGLALDEAARWTELGGGTWTRTSNHAYFDSPPRPTGQSILGDVGRWLGDQLVLALRNGWPWTVERGRTSDAVQVQALVDQLAAVDLVDRHGALAGLAELGPRAHAAVEPIVQLLPDDRMVFSALRTLGRIGPAARSSVPVLERLLDGKDDRVPWHVITALDEIGGDEAVAALRRFVRAAPATDDRRSAEEVLQRLVEVGGAR